jgi:hypothetical protein
VREAFAIHHHPTDKKEFGAMDDTPRHLRKTSQQTTVRVHPGRATPWGRNDDKWFRTHKRRAYRARQAFSGETDGRPFDPLTDRIVVHQVRPGARIRVRFGIADCAPDMFEIMDGLLARADQSEAAAHLLFDLATKHAGQLILPGELTEMIKLYETSNGNAMN